MQNRGLVLLGLMGGLFLAAMDATVLAVAMPAVVEELRGEHLYAWGFTAYMLAAAVSMPVLGALSDRYGRKRWFLVTMGLFVLGSVACGLAPTMPAFLAARFLQGIGGGGMLSIPFAMAGALYQGHERGRALGRLASVWGVASVAGPLVGGAAVAFLSWEWVFYVNIPVGLLGGWAVARYHTEEVLAQGPHVDLAGALLLMAGVGGLLLSLEEMLRLRWAWASAGALLLAAFFARERRAERPILPLDLLAKRRVLSANGGAMLAAVAVFVPIAFVPRFVEGAFGEGRSLAAVFPLSIGWSLTSYLTGRHLRGPARIRLAALAGLALLAFALALAPRAFATGLAGVALGSLAIGVGMGLLTPALLLAVQDAAPVERMGVATASQTFLRNVGGAVGVVALGALIPMGLERTLAGVAPALLAAAAVAAVGLFVVALGLRGAAPTAPSPRTR